MKFDQVDSPYAASASPSPVPAVPSPSGAWVPSASCAGTRYHNLDHLEIEYYPIPKHFTVTILNGLKAYINSSQTIELAITKWK